MSSFFSNLFGSAKKIEVAVVSDAEAVASTQLYGIVKGIAQIAVVADPALGVIVNDAISTIDLLLADVRSQSKTAVASVTALKASASALLVATAGVVTVKPNVALSVSGTTHS